MRDRTSKPEAVIVILMKDDRVLVIRRGPEASMPGHWAPLSGRIEAGESQAEAVVREVHEELGLEVTPLARVWECDTDDRKYRLHWWTARIEAGELNLHPGEVSEARWVTPAEFGAMEPTFEGDQVFFEQVYPTLEPAS